MVISLLEEVVQLRGSSRLFFLWCRSSQLF